MTVLHGFQAIRDEMIPELNTRAQLYHHLKTGAELLSMQNNDENKVFAITFTTLPEDSTGVAHIMEHSVLSGSRKYPVKEPFIQLVKGSLQTFLNALTFPDKTMYPVASQNLQDFYNLIDVYLDAVFYPNISPQTLQQEGWHYEIDDDGELAYKGVVFNEMKGAYADPDNLLSRVIQQSLYPSSSYGVDSGGDPEQIPNLRYKQFKRFHETYYHPTNARIFFYGDDPPEERLRLIDEYLKDFSALETKAQVELQPPLDRPRRTERGYAVGEGDGSTGGRGILTVNWMLDECTDDEALLGLAILDHILVGVPASPLRQALINSGLGEDLAGGGVELDLRQPAFSAGLKGIDPANADAVEALVLGTLRDLAEQGIDPAMIEAAVNTVEFERRELNTGSLPRGLSVGWRALGAWLYGRDPLMPLHIDAPFAALRQRLNAGEPYFETLIQRQLLENMHRTTVLLKPDPDLRRQQEAAEQGRLAAARAAMREEDLERVRATMEALRRHQETPDLPEALATIPSLRVADLDRENKRIPIEITETESVRLLYHDLPTNGIFYFDVGFNLHALESNALPYAALFGRALLEMGTATEDYVQLSQRIGRATGGIEPRVVASAVVGTDRATVWSFLRGKATAERAGDLFEIMRDVLLTVRLDNRERFRQIVLEEKAILESQLMPQGHVVVRDRLSAQRSEHGWAADRIGGVEYLFFLRTLAERAESDWPDVLQTLEGIRACLVNRHVMIANATVDAASWNTLQPQVAAFLGSLPATQPDLQQWQRSFAPADEGLVIPAQVNYVGKAANLYELGYEFHGSLVPLINWLQTGYLWERIRMQGGAYGAFASFDWRSGIFSMLSYRDPNLLSTIDVFDSAADLLRRLEIDEDEVEKAIIGAIGLVDAYQLPDAKGFTSMLRFLTGETDDVRRRIREEILATTAEHFRAMGDVLGRLNEAGTIVVMGSEDAIRRASAQRGGQLRVQHVL